MRGQLGRTRGLLCHIISQMIELCSPFLKTHPSHCNSSRQSNRNNSCSITIFNYHQNKPVKNYYKAYQRGKMAWEKYKHKIKALSMETTCLRHKRVQQNKALSFEHNLKKDDRIDQEKHNFSIQIYQYSLYVQLYLSLSAYLNSKAIRISQSSPGAACLE